MSKNVFSSRRGHANEDGLTAALSYEDSLPPVGSDPIMITADTKERGTKISSSCWQDSENLTTVHRIGQLVQRQQVESQAANYQVTETSEDYKEK